MVVVAGMIMQSLTALLAYNMNTFGRDGTFWADFVGISRVELGFVWFLMVLSCCSRL